MHIGRILKVPNKGSLAITINNILQMSHKGLKKENSKKRTIHVYTKANPR